MSKLIDLIGQTFNRLTVIERAENGKAGQARWHCTCICGNIITVLSSNLQRDLTKSCGCYKIDKSRKHGMGRSSEYRAWDKMKRRCNSPNDPGFKNYGGRGIKVCDAWMESFENFFKYVGHKPSPLHSIDRINNNGNYEPGNVRWATVQEQHNNKRSNHLLTINGTTLNITQWATLMNINRNIIYARITQLGWTPEKAVSHPVIKHG